MSQLSIKVDAVKADAASGSTNEPSGEASKLENGRDNSMSAFSPLDNSSQVQTALHAQTATPIVQQPDQAPSLTSTNLVGSLSGNLFSALLAGIWVAFVFFHLGMRVARRQARYHDRTAGQRQHIQTLERIWQLSAKRKD